MFAGNSKRQDVSEFIACLQIRKNAMMSEAKFFSILMEIETLLRNPC